MRSDRALRFARAMALLSTASCGASPTPATAPPPARPVVVDRCATCACARDSVNPPYCDAEGRSGCCPIVMDFGPLSPPDLPRETFSRS